MITEPIDRSRSVGRPGETHNDLAIQFEQHFGLTIGEALKYVLSVAWSLERKQEDAEDLAHDVLEKLIKKLKGGALPAVTESSRGYLRKTVVYQKFSNDRRADADMRRANVRHASLDENDIVNCQVSFEIGPEEHSIRSDEERSIREILSRLPDKLREVAELKIFDDLTHAQIAQRLDIRPGTSKRRLSDAIRLLTSSAD
ncbi:RNA polymerase sigma factor [Streptosporangium sp. NPDC000396]|uniref:RNA polymerase sigma factor n=1 Tax=Streptosporangium sp. NPDC000396 TaxID=3366185 RepID=UPI00369ED239